MLASGLILGTLAALSAGGRIQRLATLELRWWPVLAIGFGVRLLAPYLGEPFPAWIFGFSAILAVAFANRRIPGMWAIFAGALLNVVVVLVNGAMPVDPAATAYVGIEIPSDGLHRELRAGDQLALIADRIPVPVVARVYSAGDIVLALGGFWVPFSWMRRA
jgi:hypothetical protein